MSDKITLTQQQAETLCESIDLDSEFFDAENRGWRLLKMSNPRLLEAYEVLFAMSTEPEGEHNVPELKTYGESASVKFVEMDELLSEQTDIVFEKLLKGIRESKINIMHEVLSKGKDK